MSRHKGFHHLFQKAFFQYLGRDFHHSSAYKRCRAYKPGHACSGASHGKERRCGKGNSAGNRQPERGAQGTGCTDYGGGAGDAQRADAGRQFLHNRLQSFVAQGRNRHRGFEAGRAVLPSGYGVHTNGRRPHLGFSSVNARFRHLQRYRGVPGYYRTVRRA